MRKRILQFSTPARGQFCWKEARLLLLARRDGSAPGRFKKSTQKLATWGVMVTRDNSKGQEAASGSRLEDVQAGTRQLTVVERAKSNPFHSHVLPCRHSRGRRRASSFQSHVHSVCCASVVGEARRRYRLLGWRLHPQAVTGRHNSQFQAASSDDGTTLPCRRQLRERLRSPAADPARTPEWQFASRKSSAARSDATLFCALLAHVVHQHAVADIGREGRCIAPPPRSAHGSRA